MNGLPEEEEHYTTARDLAPAAHAIIVDFPDRLDLFASDQGPGRPTRSSTPMTASLIALPSTNGMKTIQRPTRLQHRRPRHERDGRKLVAVVLGEQSVATRRARATDLLENGWERWFWKSLFGTEASTDLLSGPRSATRRRIWLTASAGGRSRRAGRNGRRGWLPGDQAQWHARPRCRGSGDRHDQRHRGCRRGCGRAPGELAGAAVAVTKATERDTAQDRDEQR